MKNLASYFFKGLLFTVPLVVTVYVLYLVFTTIDGILNIPIQGLGFLITIAAITVIGILTSNIFTKKLVSWVDVIFNRLPIIKLLYGAVKDLINAFVGDKKSFNKPVFVDIAANGIKIAGFLTQEDLAQLGLKDYVAVYLPQSYNFAGNIIMVPRDRITPIDQDSSTVMTFIVSGGVTGKGKGH